MKELILDLRLYFQFRYFEPHSSPSLSHKVEFGWILKQNQELFSRHLEIAYWLVKKSCSTISFVFDSKRDDENGVVLGYHRGWAGRPGRRPVRRFQGATLERHTAGCLRQGFWKVFL